MIFCPQCHSPNTTVTWRLFRWSGINNLLARYCLNCRRPLTFVCPVCRHLHQTGGAYCTERGIAIASFRQEQETARQRRQLGRIERRRDWLLAIMKAIRNWRSWAIMATMWLITAMFGCYLATVHDTGGWLTLGASFLLKIGMSAVLITAYIVWRRQQKRQPDIKKPR